MRRMIGGVWELDEMEDDADDDLPEDWPDPE